MSTETEIQPENVFKILLATDIHLGYNEKDVIRGKISSINIFLLILQFLNNNSFISKSDPGNDSFIAFEEILYHAKSQNVDFVLLGGDLFHDTNPSKESLQR